MGRRWSGRQIAWLYKCWLRRRGKVGANARVSLNGMQYFWQHAKCDTQSSFSY